MLLVLVLSSAFLHALDDVDTVVVQTHPSATRPALECRTPNKTNLKTVLPTNITSQS
jgi:hypothetical protein